MDESKLARLEEVADRQEIHQALMRYCRGVDRGDEALILSAFHSDGIADYGQPRPATALAAGAANAPMRQLMHFTGNVLIELEGDTAYTESYFISFSPLDENGTTSTRTRAGRYLDRFERRAGEWRIAYRRLLDEWVRIDEITRLPENWGEHLGVRGGGDDDVFHMAERLR
jgi:hypothetical protein